MSLTTALNQQLSRHLESMKAIRDANFDRPSNSGLIAFTILEYLDPATRKAPSKYRVELRGVAIDGGGATRSLPRCPTDIEPIAPTRPRAPSCV